MAKVAQEMFLDAPTPNPAPTTASSSLGDRESVAHQDWVGDHELLGEIARGGMGIVFRARQHSLNRVVALKMILDTQIVEQQAISNLLREAQSAAKLDHPGIVPIYEVGQHQGRPYFTMALVEGPSLATRLAREPYSPQEAAEVVRQVADAIAYAHRQKIIHLDIKPANVLLDPENRVRITDFGVARSLDREAALDGRFVGTPQYMPPEQAEPDGVIGTWSDIYSMGALLYACITGRPPHWAATPAEIIYQVLHHDPVSPRRLNPAISPELEAIVMQALSKQADQRYPTAQLFAEDLQRFLHGKPVHARAPHGWQWLMRQARKHLVLASVSGFAAILLIGLALAITLAFLQARWELQQAQETIEDLRSKMEFERSATKRAKITSTDEEVEASL